MLFDRNLNIYAYLIPVFFVLLASLYPKSKTTNRKKLFLFYSIIFVMFLMMSLRTINGFSDPEAYHEVFEKLKQYSFKTMLYGTHIFKSNDILSMESGYCWLNWIVAHLGLNFFGFIVVYSLFCCTSVAYFIKKYSKDVLFSLFIFLCVGVYKQSFVMYRQHIAFCILLFAVDPLIKRKFCKFSFIVILAVLFHRTALSFFLVYPLRFFKTSIENIVLFVIVSILIIPTVNLSYRQIIIPLLDYLDKEAYILEGFVFREMSIAFILIAAYYLFVQKKVSDLNNEKDNSLFWSLALFFPIMVFGMRIPEFTRVGMFMYLPFSSVVLANTTISFAEKNTKFALFTEVAIKIVLFAYLVFILYIDEKPFITIFQSPYLS